MVLKRTIIYELIKKLKIQTIRTLCDPKNSNNQNLKRIQKLGVNLKTSLNIVDENLKIKINDKNEVC